MDDSDERSVEERLEKLEATIDELRDVVRQLAAATRRRSAPPAPRRPRPAAGPLPDTPPTEARPLRPPGARPPRTPGPAARLLERGPEFWVSRVGIGLLLVGLAFLFKYAVDKGWLTPWIRVLFGLGLGGTLATVGFRVPLERRRFSQIMLGGASATWYITGFAAFQLFELVSHPVAFGFMAVVTVFTFWASVQQDEAVLSLVGAVGGLSTPFMLYTETGTIPGLVSYTLVLLTGTSAIYLMRGWRSLLWTTAIGGWLVLVIAVENRAGADRPVIQAGLIGFWLLFWLVPIVRELLSERDPDRWPRPAVPGWATLKLSNDPHSLGHLAVLVLITPLAVLALSRGIWYIDDGTWGAISLAGTGAYWATAWYLGREAQLRVLVSAHRVTGAALLAVAGYFLLDGHALLVGWTALGLGLHVYARLVRDRALGNAAHVLFGAIVLWLAQRLVGDGAPTTAIANVRALADLGVIGLGLAASRWVDDETGAAYRLVAHGAVLAWFWRELAVLPGGNGIVTTAWGLYGLAIVIFLRPARRIGLATMFAAVGKLVLYDLNNVDPLIRILLFMSFGGVFLGLGYYFPALWKANTEQSHASE